MRHDGTITLKKIRTQYGGDHSFQNRTGPRGRIMKIGNQDENRFFKHKEPDFLLIS